MILIINPGSSSVKFGLFQMDEAILNTLYLGSIEGIGSAVTFNIDKKTELEPKPKRLKQRDILHISTSEDAYSAMIKWLVTNDLISCVTRVAYRVVHGGDYYSNSVEITAAVFKNLELLIPFAPLHQPMALKAIKYGQQSLANARHFACFDTAFHQSMPVTAQCFALPKILREQGIKPYGFHGLSYQYIAQYAELLEFNQRPRRVVVAHLGSGASTCAIKDGLSRATSMTFSPLDGLPMATRCGSLDPNAVVYMIEQLKYTATQVSDILNNHSGMLGLSGISGDISKLCLHGSEEARIALDYYVSKVCRELVAMTSELEGIDALVFTGGVGANNSHIRAAVCNKLKWLGIALDQDNNLQNQYIISNDDSNVLVFAIKTDEELVMAKEVAKL
jgi:acetate kinase